MSRNVIVITVEGNKYKIEKNGISDFALIGVLDCLVTDLKGVSRQSELTSLAKETLTKPDEKPVHENLVSLPEVEASGSEDETKENLVEVPIIESKSALTSLVAAPDLKSRILKAREAIRGLKGEVDDTDLNTMTENELQEEFEALTAQYKRLKNSQANKKK